MSLNADRRRIIADLRQARPADTLGLSDHEVEAMAFDLAEASTEALVSALHQRGYVVALEVG